MPKRVANWEPDIYDLSDGRHAAEAELEPIDDLAANRRARRDELEPVVDLEEERQLIYELAQDLRRPAATRRARSIVEETPVQPEPVGIEPARVLAQEKPGHRVAVAYQPARQGSDFYALAGMVAGAVAGAVLGLLLAPGRGEETRRQLVDQAHRQVEQGIDRVGQRGEGMRGEAGNGGATADGASTGGPATDQRARSAQLSFRPGDEASAATHDNVTTAPETASDARQREEEV